MSEHETYVPTLILCPTFNAATDPRRRCPRGGLLWNIRAWNTGAHHVILSSLVRRKPHSISTPYLSEMVGSTILTHIKSSRIGFEMRPFQGVNCDHVDKVVTETNR